jgi:Tol biopolymer transport system component
MEGERTPFLVAGTAFDETEARFSPDGRWLTYQSNETGRPEVYVQPFPTANGKWRVSTDGGAQPQWGADGREIFYVGADHRLMAAPVTLSPSPLGVQVGAPITLFSVRPDSEYAASADGQRFLVNAPLADVASAPITIVLNWAGSR